MIIEWELISRCNFNCNYCSLPDIKMELNEDKIENFIKVNLKNYRDNILFCFGGEPFLHPKIDFILNTLTKYNQKYIFQTNLSIKSTLIITQLLLKYKELKIQVSVHSTEQDISQYLINLNKVKSCITKIDIMYTGVSSKKDFLIINKYFNNIYLIPVAGFYEKESDKLLKEYNKLRPSKLYKLEEDKISINNKMEYRSILWERQSTGELITEGKPCLYKDNYILWDSLLNQNSCCYRGNYSICNNRCFLM